MKSTDFLNSAQKVSTENKTLRLAMGVLLFANLILTISVFNKDNTVVLVPPELTEEVRVSLAASNLVYKKAWANYVANVIGNVNKANIDFSISSIEGLFSSRVQSQFKELMSSEAKNMKANELSVSFYGDKISYQPSTGLIYVTGSKTVYGLADKSEKETVTFEFDIQIKNYKPLIENFNFYKGKPKNARREK